MERQEELKPVNCGCGGKAIVHEQEDGEFDVYCPVCFITTDDYKTETYAVEAWNKAMGERTAKVTQVERGSTTLLVWRCENCGQYMHRASWAREVNYCSHCGAKLDWSGNE